MNKKSHLVGVLLLFITLQLSAQSNQQKVDSLLLLIENATEDTTKVNHYNDLGSWHVYSEPNKAVEFLHKGLALATKAEFENGLIQNYTWLFNVHDVLGSNSDSLLIYIRLMEELYEKTQNIKYNIKVYWNYGIYYRKSGQNDKVIEAYLTALGLVRKSNYPELAEGQLLDNIGDAFESNDNYSKALEYYQKATPFFKESKIGQTINYLNLGSLYSRKLIEADTALPFLNKAYSLAEEIKHYNLQAAILIEQGYCNDLNEDYEKANQLYKKALNISEKYNLGENFITLFASFAEHYLKREQYQQAILYCNKAIRLSEEKKDYLNLASLSETQEKAYVALGNYKNAYEVKTQRSIHLDSINNAEVKGKIEELQTKYEVEQKEAENNLLKLNLKNRKRSSIILMIALIFAVAFGIAVFRSSQQRKKYNQILEQKVAERTKDLKQANYELRTFNYIASHDIKEPIRVIGGHVGLIKRSLPEDLKEKLSEYFNTIKRSTTQLYTLIEDFAFYITMSRDETIQKQNISLNELSANVIDGLQETITKYKGKVIVSELPTILSSSSLLFTTLKNLVENGLKYNQSEQPTVNIDYQDTETHHEIIVSDNGIGIKAEYNEQIFEMFKRLHSRIDYEGSGIGLAIVKLSIGKLDGDLKLESEEGKGSRFIIQLPKN